MPAAAAHVLPSQRWEFWDDPERARSRRGRPRRRFWRRPWGTALNRGPRRPVKARR